MSGGAGGGDGLVDVCLDEGLEDATGLSGDTDADRGIAEDLAVLLRVPEQRPQRDDPALALFAGDSIPGYGPGCDPERRPGPAPGHHVDQDQLPGT
ncbi:hypothetical protein ACFTXM_42230 [Streptomyces sp. NPDC056930]|uniref:hypothetical protein n=1 Tax=Streptomyces sp. NPDC056930 TaxID=3345967 RepID=UPI003638F8A8